MVKTASVFSRLETMEYLSGKRQGLTDESRNRDFHALWFYALKVTSHVTEDRARE